ncbi:MAG: hypothetical protein D6701_11895, partial [Gemmatimonadetes bacterium]
MLVLLAAIPVFAPAVRAQRAHVTLYTNREGLPQGQVFDVRQGPLGYLWMATYGGLTRYDGETFRAWTVRDGLVSNAVRSVAPTAGHVWVATERGLCVLKGDEVGCPHTDLRMFGVTRLTADAGGWAWAASPTGVARVAPSGA